MAVRARRPGPWLLWLTSALMATCSSATPTTAAERRCGWLENPTPANYSLRDREAEWTLSEQGGFQARGIDSLPDMTTAGWVETNGHYGYGCACLTVTVDRKRTRVIDLSSAQPVALARCRSDHRLPRP